MSNKEHLIEIKGEDISSMSTGEWRETLKLNNYSIINAKEELISSLPVWEKKDGWWGLKVKGISERVPEQLDLFKDNDNNEAGDND